MDIKMLFSSRYFFVQRFNFAVLGINPLSDNSKTAIERPLLFYGLVSITFFNMLLIGHYIFDNRDDILEMADAFPIFGQSILTIVKMGIFITKRHEIMEFIKFINELNATATDTELSFIRRENRKEIALSSIYFKTVVVTCLFGILYPIIYAVYTFFATGNMVFLMPNKATFFWPHSTLSGYSLVLFISNVVIYYCCCSSLAVDTLFSWFVYNIVAQYHILFQRFHNINKNGTNTASNHHDQQKYFKAIAACVRHHCQTLDLCVKLNHVYGEIIFIKFVIICAEICCLAFYVLHSKDSMANSAYKCLYLAAVAIQLSLYCYCGQMIKDVSSLVGTRIYEALDWPLLNKTNQKMLLISMQRSMRCTSLRGVFFEMDLALYLWVFKTAASLMTALKTLEENRE